VASTNGRGVQSDVPFEERNSADRKNKLRGGGVNPPGVGMGDVWFLRGVPEPGGPVTRRSLIHGRCAAV